MSAIIRVATTVAGTLASSFKNGDTIDGVVLTTNDVILIKNQSVGTENGVYIVNVSGAPTRSHSFRTGISVAKEVVFVTNGIINANSSFLITNVSGSDIVGTDTLTFVRNTIPNAVSTDGIQTLSNKTLTLPKINDTSADNQYIFGVNELTVDRTITLPLLTGNDTFVFEQHIQSLTNKNITGSTNTVEASQLQTTGMPVIINTNSPSAAGQVLVTTTTTNATWQTSSALNVNLQQAYDNSTSPEIVLDTTRGALTLQDNSTPIATNLFEIQNNGGSTTYFSVTATRTTIDGDATITGDLLVEGTTTTVQSEIVKIADNHLYLNDGYTISSAQTGGLVVNYLPTSTTDTVAATGFVAGIASTSNPTVNTVGATIFSANDLIQISGANTTNNNGLFEVLTHIANVLTIRGVGTMGTIEDFTQNQFTTDTIVAGVITQVNVTVMRGGIDGIWESGSGLSVASFTFRNQVDVSSSQILTNKTINTANNTLTIDTGDITTGTLVVTRGGTGVSTLTNGNVLVGNGTGAVTTTKTAPSGDFVGTSDIQTLTNKTITSPIINEILDSNGNKEITFITTTSAVNEVTITNSATTNNPIISGTGGDTNIGIDLQVKGTGVYRLLGTANVAAEVQLFEDTSNGTNYTGLKAANAISTTTTFTLPSTDGNSNQFLQTDGSTILSFSSLSIRIFSDEKAVTTAGGTFTAGAWQTRTLNTTRGNMTGTSLSTNQFTLPAGEYLIESSSPAYRVDQHQSRLQNISDATTDLISQTSETVSSGGSADQSIAFITGYISIASSKNFEIQHRCSNTQSTDGFGRAVGFTTEVYTLVKVFQLG